MRKLLISLLSTLAIFSCSNNKVDNLYSENQNLLNSDNAKISSNDNKNKKEFDITKTKKIYGVTPEKGMKWIYSFELDTPNKNLKKSTVEIQITNVENDTVQVTLTNENNSSKLNLTKTNFDFDIFDSIIKIANKTFRHNPKYSVGCDGEPPELNCGYAFPIKTPIGTFNASNLYISSKITAVGPFDPVTGLPDHFEGDDPFSDAKISVSKEVGLLKMEVKTDSKNNLLSKFNLELVDFNKNIKK
ncbi:MAG: hypothetical protein U0457_12135 [Candidatus Sericytochromatia bacterium]